MKRFILFFIGIIFYSLTNFSNANTIDSLTYRQLVKEGQSQLCRLFDINDEAIENGKLDDMRFVVMLSENEAPINYTQAQTVNGHAPSSASQSPEADTLNARIRKIYQQYGIELYLIYINSLDIIIHSPLPEEVTYQQLFQKKLYDNETNLDSLRAEHEKISNDIIENNISGRQRDCVILSEGEYCGTFSHDGEKRGCWLFNKAFLHRSATPTYSELSSVYSDFGNRLSNNSSYRHGGINVSAEAAVDAFGEAAKYSKLRNQLMNVFLPNGIKDILAQFHYPEDYTGLTVDQRRHVLSVFAGYAMFSSTMISQGEEELANKVLTTVPANQTEDVLYFLSQPSYLHDNPLYAGEAGPDAIIFMLVYHIDDGHFLSSDTNYKDFIQTLSHLITSNETVFANHLPVDDEGWHNRQIQWKKYGSATLPKIGTPTYSANLQSNGTVRVTRNIVSKWNIISVNESTGKNNYTAVWSVDTNFYLNPFDLVFFKYEGDNSMVTGAGITSGEISVVPAIFLQYASDKEFNALVLKSIIVTVDLIGIAVGPGAIIGAIEIGNVAAATYEALQFLGSAARLAEDGITNPNVRSVIEKYNLIIGVWGFAHLTTSVGKFTSNYFSKVKSGEVNTIPEGVANDFKQSYESAEGGLSELSAAEKERLDRMNEYLEERVGNVDIFNSVIRGVTFQEFKATVLDFANPANASLAEESFRLWVNKDWPTLEKLFNDNHLNVWNGLSYPPNNGAIDVVKITLDPADFGGNLVIDRYGPPTGKYASPINTPFTQRALPASSESNTLKEYKVLLPIEGVEKGTIIPWFGQEGMGIQYKLQESINYYISEEHRLVQIN